MALATFDDLKGAIASWLVRTDLTAAIPDFITLAESRINRELRVREMVTQDSDTIAVQDLAVPSDFIEVVRLTLDTATDKPLEYRPIEDSESRVAGVTSGEPRWFSILGGNFRFYPAPDGPYTYTLDYYAKVQALSDSNTTNWLLAKAPDVYLFASLAEAYAFLLEEERETYWTGRFEKARMSLQSADSRAKRTSGPRRARVLT